MEIIEEQALEFSGLVRPGDRLAWGQCAGEPLTLTRALMAQRHRIGGRFSVFLGTTWGDAVAPEHADVVDFQAYSGAGRNRALAEAGVLDILCCHYSEFERALGPGGASQVDVLLLHVAPADPQGRYSLSTTHEYLVPLIASARLVIAEVNRAAPWTFGARSLNASDLDFVVHTDRAVLASPKSAPGASELAIADHVASLIDDGATLQTGVGAVPDAVLGRLKDRRDLGIHSGAVTDAVAELLELGVVTNARKTIDAGVTIAGVLMGGEKLNKHVHLNPSFQMRATAYTHAVETLSRIDRLVAINSAIEVDLTGQVNAEVAGDRYVGAVGGAIDFIRGARQSRGGISVIALPARAGSRSRIVANLQGPVSTLRSDVAFVVTEFGIADLRGAGVAKRVSRMLAIAHPDLHAQLEAEAPNNRRAIS